MARYVSLVSLTDQGIRHIKDSPDRAAAFVEMAKRMGVTVESLYWTVGQYDIVTTVEGDEEACTALLMAVGALGNIRTQTMRAFTADEMRKITGKMG